jgi:hypothetical protein
MNRHRFREELAVSGFTPGEPSAPAVGAFVACPVALCPGTGLSAWQQNLYRLALEQAQAANQPSLLERSLVRSAN